MSRAAKKRFTAHDADPVELLMGIEHELEHTTNAGIATQIALDHLAEHPNYYSILEKAEAKMAKAPKMRRKLLAPGTRRA